MLRKLLKPGLIFLAGLSGATLLIGGLINYPGSKLIYILFTVIFWLMLITAFGKRTRYGYLFLVMALWMGFWAKITAHLLLNYPYVEPTGRFDESASAWDGVLWVAISASTGVMLGKLLLSFMGMKYARIVNLDEAKVPAWYPAFRKWLWPLALALVLCIGALNLILGIQQIGLVPRTILPWPLNALIAWQVSMGSALLLTVLLWWEIALKRSISLSVYALLMEAMTSTTTLLSRGVYIFHTVPQFFALYENRRSLVGVSKARTATFTLAFAALLMITISVVTTFRAYLYPHAGGFTTEEQMRLTRLEVLAGGIANVRILISKGEHQELHLGELLAEKEKLEAAISKNRVERSPAVAASHSDDLGNAASPASTPDRLLENKGKLLSELSHQLDAGALPRILSLVIDRWIGLEGVMAVSAYPEKSNQLLFEAITEKREIGSTTKFQEIANSHYRWVDANIWQFASLPGAAAFFYFSGSLWVVMLGMAIFSVLLQLSEQFVFRLTSNPLLCAMFGLTLANTISQFGITPRQDLPFYSMIFAFVLLVWMLQSDKVSRMYLNHVAQRGKRGSV